jgi:hypothetical protein
LKIITGRNVIVSNDTALLVGGKATLFPDGKERLTARLIAYKGPSGPPMDITDQVLEKYYAGTGMGLTNFLWDSFHSLSTTNEHVQIIFCSFRRNWLQDGFDCTLSTSWRGLDEIIEEVGKTGKMKREKWSGFEYLQKE